MHLKIKLIESLILHAFDQTLKAEQRFENIHLNVLFAHLNRQNSSQINFFIFSQFYSNSQPY